MDSTMDATGGPGYPGTGPRREMINFYIIRVLGEIFMVLTHLSLKCDTFCGTAASTRFPDSA